MEQNYLTDRVDKMIKWYNVHGMRSKHYHLTSKVCLTVTAAMIPAHIAYVEEQEYVKVLIALLSVMTVILVNIDSIFRFRENWLHYQRLGGLLTSEKYMYLSESGPYSNNPDKFRLFVETIEKHMKEEGKQWVNEGNTPKKNNSHTPIH
jgi:uncharacterized protein DUF4231